MAKQPPKKKSVKKVIPSTIKAETREELKKSHGTRQGMDATWRYYEDINKPPHTMPGKGFHSRDEVRHHVNLGNKSWEAFRAVGRNRSKMEPAKKRK